MTRARVLTILCLIFSVARAIFTEQDFIDYNHCDEAFWEPTLSLFDFNTVFTSNKTAELNTKWHFPRIQIINNELQEIPGWKNMTDIPREASIVQDLYRLSHAVKLPDLDFLVNSLDESRQFKEPSAVLEYCTVAPVTSFIMPHAMGKDTETMVHIANDEKPTRPIDTPWSKREAKAIWRGTTTGWPRPTTADFLTQNPRGKLCMIAKEHSDLIDFGFSGYVQAKVVHPEIEKECPIGSRISLIDQANKFKYIIDVDGNAWSSRFMYLLSLGVTVVKQASPFIDNITPVVKAGEHFVEIKADLSDLVPTLKWLRDNDDVAERIAKKARHDSLASLGSAHDNNCYWYFLLKRMGQQSRDIVKVDYIPPPPEELEVDDPNLPRAVVKVDEKNVIVGDGVTPEPVKEEVKSVVAPVETAPSNEVKMVPKSPSPAGLPPALPDGTHQPPPGVRPSAVLLFVVLGVASVLLNCLPPMAPSSRIVRGSSSARGAAAKSI